MVGDEDCIVEPRLFTGLVDTLADRVISVLHRAIATVAGVDVDPIIRIGHQLQQKWLLLGIVGVRLFVAIFVAIPQAF